jgi:type IV secretion system protein VirB10
VPKGTQLPLALHNTVSTHSAHVGDQVYLETVFPIVIDGRILIPAGSYASGEITEVKRPGRIRGRGELGIKLDRLILPNAYDVDFNATPRDADTGGNETVDKEGVIQGDSDKAGDASTIIRTSGTGAIIGAIASRSGEGAGIGAGVGAATGLAAVLLTRGPDAVLPRGTTLNVTLNRPLYLLADKINFTSLGQTPVVVGSPYRQPRRARIPFPF